MKTYQGAFFKYFPLLLLIGFLAGLLNGLLGAGGGILIVIGLRAIFGKEVSDSKRFYATAIAVMLPLSVISAWQYMQNGHLPTLSLGLLVLPALCGGIIGALLLRLIRPLLLARIFAAVVLVSGIVLVI